MRILLTVFALAFSTLNLCRPSGGGSDRVCLWISSERSSERLAKWLFDLAVSEVEDDRVQVHLARIYETLAPVQAVAEFVRD